jgi:hypothetical protein
VAGHGSSQSHLGVWFLGSDSQNVKKAVVALLGVLLVVAFVHGLRRMLSRPAIPTTTALDEGNVALLSPSDDAFSIEMSALQSPTPTSHISPGSVLDDTVDSPLTGLSPHTRVVSPDTTDDYTYPPTVALSPALAEAVISTTEL